MTFRKVRCWLKRRRTHYEQMFSAVRLITDIPGLDRRKLLVRLEGCYSCSSEKDSNPELTAAQVIALALSFSELYQNCEVRSFGEKCRLQPQIAVSSAISSTVIQLKGLSLSGILGPVDRVRWQTAQ